MYEALLHDPTRSLIAPCYTAGIALAKQRGAYHGRKQALSSAQAAELRQRANAGEQKAALARAFGISRETLYQYLKRAATLGHEVSRERAG